jgi:hypothetical protein
MDFVSLTLLYVTKAMDVHSTILSNAPTVNVPLMSPCVILLYRPTNLRFALLPLPLQSYALMVHAPPTSHSATKPTVVQPKLHKNAPLVCVSIQIFHHVASLLAQVPPQLSVWTDFASPVSATVQFPYQIKSTSA